MRHGLILIDKPIGYTSHDAVAVVRRALGEKDIGHLGTLDPAATGLLVLAVGSKALKCVELLSDLTKTYEAEVKLGAVSTTYDREGVIEEVPLKPGVKIPDDITIQNTIQDRFLGKISQVPPEYSAISIGGERAYKKARRGVGVNIPARDVTIHACNVLSYDYPILKLSVTCGSGTYIRSLAHDLGQMLHTGGYLAGLRRTKVGLPAGAPRSGAKAGEWDVAKAVEPEKAIWPKVMPLKDCLGSFPRLDLTAEEMDHLSHGRDIEKSVTYPTIGWYDDLPAVILEPKNGKAHAKKVL
ncbi:tRNA pseudouridine(55) synthase TruB [Candidatus Peregrinibacteria bacterium]|nr:tRNA pseudouridine(55) synthase TruB [Candidatus Peregrinibacteria bacterium]